MVSRAFRFAFVVCAVARVAEGCGCRATEPPTATAQPDGAAASGETQALVEGNGTAPVPDVEGRSWPTDVHPESDSNDAVELVDAAVNSDGDGAQSADDGAAPQGEVVAETETDPSGSDDGPGETVPTGACADGVDLPMAGDPCAKEFDVECSRVGEKPTVVSSAMQVLPICHRPNQVQCKKVSDGTLKWQITPCQFPPAGCFSALVSCRRSGDAVGCCTDAVDVDKSAIPVGPAGWCTVQGQGHLWCAGNIYECGTFDAIYGKSPPLLQKELDTAYAKCKPASPACLYYYPNAICPLLDAMKCSGWKDAKSKYNRYCTANYEGQGPACLMNCDDFKKYSKDYQPPKPK